MLGVASSHQIGESAAKWSRCPICFEALHERPHEVGALMFENQRVESALYHKSCMMDETGKLRLSDSLTPPWYRSPISRQEVDSFELMPPISKRISWTKFVDWNSDGKVDIEELATAIAAILPVQEHVAEKLVSARFDKDCSGFIEAKEIRDHVLPFIRAKTARMVAETKVAPKIFSSSSHQDFIKWFDSWDKKEHGYLTQPCLRLAISTCFESEVPALRPRLAHLVLDEAGFFSNEVVSREVFQRRVVPVLRMNLPHESEEKFVGSSKADCQPYDPKRPWKINLLSGHGSRKVAIVAPTATVGDLRSAARRQFRVWLGWREAELCMNGKMLLDDSSTLLSLPYFLGETVVQVLPKARVDVPRHTKVEKSDCSDDDDSDDGSFVPEFSDSSECGSGCDDE